MAYKKNFIPLESDPTIFTELMYDLGVSTSHDEVDHHYITLVKRSNRLYVLDGEMQGPIDRVSLEDGEDV